MNVKQRPVYLNLFAIRQPIAAIVSILHRASGVFVFLLIPLLLWALAKSLGTPLGFQELQSQLAQPFLKFVLWLVLTALVYHLLAGIRHLLMDVGIGENYPVARKTATLTLVLGIIIAIALGIWLW